MPTITLHFEKLKKRFVNLNQDVLDSFLQQHGKLTEVFSEALENFLLAKHIEVQGESVFVKNPTETTAIVKPSEQLPPLTNARQKEAYCYKAEHLGNIVNAVFSEPCGLAWDKEKQVISGIPDIGGKEIVVTFQFDNDTQKTANLYINADPRSLWNNIPSQDLVKEYWKADSDSALEKTPYGTLIAARQRGRSHAHKGTCCDDDFAFGFHQPTGIHFMAVADGAGSAEYSRLGSKLAVEKAKETFFELLNDVSKQYYNFPKLDANSSNLKDLTTSILGQMVYSAFLAQQKAINEKITEKSLSSTLLLTFVVPLQSGKWFTATYWVGDGAVAVFNPQNKDVYLLGESDGGQYSGETQFLSKAEFVDEQWKQRIQMTLSECPPVLFAMTDGVSDPKFKNDAALTQSESWSALWAELQAPLNHAEPEKALEQWLDFWSVGEHDDRTLAMFIPAVSEEIAEKGSESTACHSEQNNNETPTATNPLTLQKVSDVAEVQAVESEPENAKLPTVTLLESTEAQNG